jgi:hypothetical protein
LALEKEAYPALDELTSKVSTLNLEHVRQIKSRLVGLSGRVQKVRRGVCLIIWYNCLSTRHLRAQEGRGIPFV